MSRRRRSSRAYRENISYFVCRSHHIVKCSKPKKIKNTL